MGAHADVLDGSLDQVKDNCDRVVFCSAEPTTYTEGNSTYNVASYDTPSITKGDEGTGRKLTFAAKSSITINMAGTNNATYIALLDTVNLKLLDTWALGASVPMTYGNTTSHAAFDYVNPQPTVA